MLSGVLGQPCTGVRVLRGRVVNAVGRFLERGAGSQCSIAENFQVFYGKCAFAPSGGTSLPFVLYLVTRVGILYLVTLRSGLKEKWEGARGRRGRGWGGGDSKASE